MLRRKSRVRMHLLDAPGVELPSVEGLLVGRRRSEYVVGVPRLVTDPVGVPADLDSRYLVIPRERVAFYEVIG